MKSVIYALVLSAFLIGCKSTKQQLAAPPGVANVSTSRIT